MEHRDSYRDLLVANLAVVLEADTARNVASVLEGYWGKLERAKLEAELELESELGRVADLTIRDLRRLEEKVSRLIVEAGESTRGRTSVPSHGDVPSPGAVRPNLRLLPQGRYGDFTPIGVGGMGMVFLTFDRELDRQVAFKIVSPRMDARCADSPFELRTPSDPGACPREFTERTARFLQEARVTSSLEHPGILPVYELGRTPGGLPYYTMRYVRGEQTLADALERTNGLEDRLALVEPFLRVCDTIQYAHFRGFLHRDLKPDNVALGEFGEVVILDWGLARARSADATGGLGGDAVGASGPRGGLTTSARALGTPGYMSPEAARGDVDRVDERSDVYSLGATLYQILTGARPFADVPIADLPTRLQTEDPPPATRNDLAVPAELDEICSRALARRPEDRFASVADLATAIRVWRRRSETEREAHVLLVRAEAVREGADGLAGNALLAQLDRVTSIALRVRELRPREPRATALILECAARREGAIAGRERRARRRMLRRASLAGLVVLVLATVAFMGLLEKRRQEAEEARASAEDLAAFMLFDLHRGLEEVGRLDLLGPAAGKVLAHYERLRAESLGEDELRRWSVALRNVGSVFRSRGDLPAAREALEESLGIRERLVAATPSSALRRGLADIHLVLAEVLHEQGRSDRALEHDRRGEAILERLFADGPDDPVVRRELAKARIATAGILRDRGEAAAAIERCDRVIHGLGPGSGRVAVTARDREVLADALEARGEIQIGRGEPDAGLASFEEALDARRRVATLEPDRVAPKEVLADVLERIGRERILRGRTSPGLARLDDALAIRRWLARHDPSNAIWRVSLARTLAQVADARERMGDRPGSLLLYRESLDIARRLCRDDPSGIEWQRVLARDLVRVAFRRQEANDLDGALEHSLEVLAIRRRLATADPGSRARRRELSAILLSLGSLRRGRRESELALDRLDEAVLILERLVEENGTRLEHQRMLADGRRRIAEIRVERGETEAAAILYRAAIGTLEQVVQREPEDLQGREALARARTARGNLLSRIDRYPEATAEHDAAIGLWRQLVRTEPRVALRHLQLAYARGLQANHLARMERVDDALEAYRVAVEDHARSCALNPEYAAGHAEYVDQHRWYGLVTARRSPETPEDQRLVAFDHHREGRYSEAVARFRRALRDPVVREDLGSPTLYYAARSAALASTSADPGEAARLRREAIVWLAEDVRKRRDLILRLAAVPPADAETEERLEKQRIHLEFARDEDPELASVRADPRFERIFAEE